MIRCIAFVPLEFFAFQTSEDQMLWSIDGINIFCLTEAISVKKRQVPNSFARHPCFFVLLSLCIMEAFLEKQRAKFQESHERFVKSLSDDDAKSFAENFSDCDNHSLVSPRSFVGARASTSATLASSSSASSIIPLVEWIDVRTDLGVALTLHQGGWSAGRVKYHVLADYIDRLGGDPDDYFVVYDTNIHNMEILIDDCDVWKFIERRADHHHWLLHIRHVADIHDYVNCIHFRHLKFPLYNDDMARDVNVMTLIDQRVCDVIYNQEVDIDNTLEHLALKVNGEVLEPNDFIEIAPYDVYVLEFYPMFQLQVHRHFGAHDIITFDDAHGTDLLWDFVQDIRNNTRVFLEIYYEDILADEDEPLHLIFFDRDLTNPNYNQDYVLHAYLEDDHDDTQSSDDHDDTQNIAYVQVIGFAIYTDEAFPFKTHRCPLYGEDLEKSDEQLKKHVHSFFSNAGVFNMKLRLSPQNFLLKKADGMDYILEFYPEIELHARLWFDEGRTQAYFFGVDDTLGLLLWEIGKKYPGLDPNSVRILYEGIDLDMTKDIKFHEFIKDIEIPYGFRKVEVIGRIRAGGKRAREPVEKESMVKQVEEELGTMTMRINSHPNASPVITEVVRRVLHISNCANDPNITPSQMISDFDVSKLKLLLKVQGCSTKVDAKCKKMADIVFNDLVDGLHELVKQTEIATKCLRSVLHVFMLKKFSDSNGNIDWDKFTTEVANVLEEVVQKNNQTPPANNVGGISD